MCFFWTWFLGYLRISLKKIGFSGISFQNILCFGISFVLNGIYQEADAVGLSQGLLRQPRLPSHRLQSLHLHWSPSHQVTEIELAAAWWFAHMNASLWLMLYVGCRGLSCWLSSLPPCLQQCWYLAHQALAYSSMATSTPTCPLEALRRPRHSRNSREFFSRMFPFLLFESVDLHGFFS